MKRFIGMLFGALMVMVGVFSSCDKNEDLNQVPQTETKETRASALRSASAFSYGMHIVGPLPYADPLHGRPNETAYKFYVANPPSDLQGVVIVFSTPAGGKVTRVMQKNSAGNFFHEQTLSQSGRYEVKYLLRYRTPKAEKTVVPASGFIDNTLVNFDGSTKKLVWPFGADGSSWNNRQGWVGSMEKGGCGQKHGQGGHKYYNNRADDRLAEDWNKNCGTSYADDGAEFRSPIDGVVEKIRIDRPNQHYGGYGNCVDLKQTIGNKTYVFRIAHLKFAPSVSVGQKVFAGKTIIGYVGESGGTSSAPHAHIVLYQEISGNYVGSLFSLDAL